MTTTEFLLPSVHCSVRTQEFLDSLQGWLPTVPSSLNSGCRCSLTQDGYWTFSNLHVRRDLGGFLFTWTVVKLKPENSKVRLLGHSIRHDLKSKCLDTVVCTYNKILWSKYYCIIPSLSYEGGDHGRSRFCGSISGSTDVLRGVTSETRPERTDGKSNRSYSVVLTLKIPDSV